MDLQLVSLTSFFTFLILLFTVIKQWKMPRRKVPPGPFKLPVIGNLHNLTGSLPHHRFTILAKKYGPIMHLKLGGVPTVVISSPELAKEVYKTHDVVFAQRPGLLSAKILSYNCAGITFAPYGKYWRQVRKICIMELLSGKRVLTFKSIREEEVSDLIESISLSCGQPVNLSENIESLTHSVTSRAAFGKKCKDQDEFIKANSETISLSGGFNIPDTFPSMKFLHFVGGMKSILEKHHQKIDKILNNIVNDHKAKRNSTTGEIEDEDLVDVLLKLQEREDLECPLTDDNLKAVILDIYAAGSETSSTTIEWAMSELMRNPQVMEKAQTEVRKILNRNKKVEEEDIEELHYLKLVVKETLRLHPPAPLLLPRESSERCEINGYEIAKKTKMIVNAYAIGRDSKYWSESERFEPERFDECSKDYKGTNYEYIPFGSGRRMCPGISFGIATVQLPLAHLLYHFNWKLQHGLKPEQLDMTEKFGATVSRKNHLYLIPTPYIP